jgi:alkanesulfonate monooxygenase SsuD/methylene tetrahydromethanopterin reductase-like flavin-dependent oxidoreductase (luciferase family)
VTRAIGGDIAGDEARDALNTEPRFGVFLPQIHMPFEVLEERVRGAEALGFHSAWLMDHLWTPGLPEAPCLEGWTTATALAARTQTIRLGHMVLCNQFRHPALLAKMAASLDVISGGRLELGLGWGSVPDEMRAFGLGDEPPALRAARLAETLEILELLFQGEPVTYRGRFHRLEGAIVRPTPLQRPLPIHVGGAGPKLTMPIVAKHAHWWNCVSSGIERLSELLPLAGQARISAQHPIALVGDPARREEVEAVARRRFGAWGGLLVGTADEITEALLAEVALGVELFVLQFSDFGELETLRRFAEEVAPAVRAQAAQRRLPA